MPNDNFDPFNWLQPRFCDIDFAELRQINGFAFLWNLFETKACQRNANPNSIKTSVDTCDRDGNLERQKYEAYVTFFSDRYFSENGLGLQGLRVSNLQHEKLVQKVLKGETQELKTIVFGLLLIAHRIRNNLFHGNKDLLFLPAQTDLFQAVNNLLADYIEDLEKSNGF